MSDETFTLIVANEAEVLADGDDWRFDYLPSDYEVVRAITDALIERALESGYERLKSMTQYKVNHSISTQLQEESTQ